MARFYNHHQEPLLPELCSPTTLLALVIIGELLSLALLLFSSHTTFIDWAAFGTLSMLVQWTLLTSVLILCRLRPVLNRCHPLINGSLAYLICLVVAGTILALTQHLFSTGFSPILWFKSWLITGIIAGILLRYLYLQQQLSNRKQAELQSRLEALQARIKPHFLFNSMNTIASLVSIDAAKAETAIEDLCELFRANLQMPGLVSLEQEMALCKRYIAIEQMRLGERLQVDWDYQPPLAAIKIPSLSLQPLLENAIVHGIQPLIDGGTVKVSITTTDTQLIITINNPTIRNVEKIQGHQLAQQNIARRLSMHFGNKSHMQINQNQADYQVRLTLPI
ncbi:MAG: histidine kinase [Cellvibrionaceae bacterium]|nr:histidine kinase [Cellvibrionaceae bacterium]